MTTETGREPLAPSVPPSGRAWTHTPAVQALEWVLILVAAIGSAMLVRNYVAQTFWIPTASMEPALEPGDRVLIDKVTLRFRDPDRGDIVVFRGPERTQLAGTDLVKRVVGLPGDRIAASKGRILIDGKPLDEPYLSRSVAGRNIGFRPFTVPDGEYFVMGDNRMASNDSRSFGTIRREDIIGRAMIRVWPISRLGNL